MTASPELELAYLAGFIDGEGCIAVNRSGRAQNAPFYLSFTASQVTREPLDWLVRRFGGGIKERRPKQPNRRNYWVWKLRNGQAEQALRTLRPFLVVKAGEADLGMAFQTALRQPRHRPLSGWEIAERESYYLALRDAKESTWIERTAA